MLYITDDDPPVESLKFDLQDNYMEGFMMNAWGQPIKVKGSDLPRDIL